MSEEGEGGGGLYYNSKTSRYCAELGILGTTDTVSVLLSGFPET
jgi:hypothetical protein